MKIEQALWTAGHGWQPSAQNGPSSAPLVLYFAAPGTMDDGARLAEMRSTYPHAKIVGCTTGGEILGGEVHDGAIALTALQFEHTAFRLVSRAIGVRTDSHQVGLQLAGELRADDLKAVFVLSDGTMVNGWDLVRGLKDGLPDGIILTGGMAGDGASFRSTLVGADGPPMPGNVVAIGFYGENVRIRHGSFGGWDPFGSERLITRSCDNVLYELDGEPALDLYKRYLGKEADHPGSALLFPLCIRAAHDRGTDIVRAVIGIDEDARSMIFAGDVPAGYSAQLMRGNFEHLVDGAGRAAAQAAEAGGGALAILISCIGRKLLLGQRIDEEIDRVCEVLGPDCRTVGFYSYGEICPHDLTASCELHNQTMTITLIDEV